MEEVKCRALLDTGAENSYILSELARRREKKPLRTNHKHIEKIFHTTPTHVEEIYEVQMTNVKDNFTINAEVSKVNKPNLISPNICYTNPIQQYFNQKGIYMNDNDEKTKIPINEILGLEIEQNQLQNTQHLDGQHIWWKRNNTEPYAVKKK